MGWFGVRQNAVSGLIFLAVIVPPIAAQGTASREGCPGAAGTGCNAFSTLKIEVTAGECTGQSGANCQALAESKTVIRNALNDWLGGDDRCGTRAREGAATIVAQAVAEVWTSAFSQVRCVGQGFACGWSAANGRAWAEGLSESIAEAAAEAEAGTQFCYADVRALAGVFSESLSQSQAEVCTSNGDAEAFLSLYQKTVETQIAESFAAANAEACASGGALAASQSLCTDGEFELGDICGGIVQNECKGDGKKRCCNPNFKRRVCRCKGCKGPWIRRSASEPKWFENRDGVRCKCPSTGRQPPPKSPPLPEPSPPKKSPPPKESPPSEKVPSSPPQSPLEKTTPAKAAPPSQLIAASVPPSKQPPPNTPSEKPPPSDIKPPSTPKSPPKKPSPKKSPPQKPSPKKPPSRKPPPEKPPPKKLSPPAVPSTPSRPPPRSCQCTNVQPPEQPYACTQQRDWGKCNEYWMLKEGYCEETCGRCNCPDSCHCTNIPPPGIFTCEQQKEFGQCDQYWMVYAPWFISGGYCQETCGRCPCQDPPESQPEKKPEPEKKSKPKTKSRPETDSKSGTCACTDNPTNDPYSCEEQRKFGKCGADWMVDGDYCKTTCGRCECPGSPLPPEEKKPDEQAFGCVCSDEPIPNSEFTCAQQRTFGKCGADWMKRSNSLPEGYCQITCGRCPCKNPKVVGTE